MRDFPGFLVSRRKILESKSTARASWIAFAAANFWMNDFNSSYDIVMKYIDNVSEKGDQYEESELYLFQNMCLVKQAKYSEALEHFDRNKALIVDKLAMNVKRAEILTLSSNFISALEEWGTLVKQQPENYNFHRGLQAALLSLPPNLCQEALALQGLRLPCNYLVLNVEKKQILKEWYSTQTIKSRAVEKISLSLYLGDPVFEDKLYNYITKCLDNGVPSLSHDVCSLAYIIDPSRPSILKSVKDISDFSSHEVIGVCLALVDRYLTNATGLASPVGTLWAWYLKAHLLEMRGEFEDALTAIDASISHTPTAIDMHAKRARLLKKMGLYVEAAETMDACRALDLQDRYLNNKATKYFLRTNEVQLAMNTIAMFTKHEGDPQKTLFDLQCSWYELELAECYARQKKWGLALKKFNAIKAHFIEQYDDLFDFHGYCIRKVSYLYSFPSINESQGGNSLPVDHFTSIFEYHGRSR
jgi:peptide alpha-N-acetyltransferase